MPRAFKLLLRTIGVVGLLTAALIVAATYIGDPLDRYEVLASIASPGERRHAVVVDYRHSDSSSQWTAIWISTKPGVVGDRGRWRERPIAVWAGTRIDPIWRNGQLVLSRPFDAGKDAGQWLLLRLCHPTRLLRS